MAGNSVTSQLGLLEDSGSYSMGVSSLYIYRRCIVLLQSRNHNSFSVFLEFPIFFLSLCSSSLSLYFSLSLTCLFISHKSVLVQVLLVSSNETIHKSKPFIARALCATNTTLQVTFSNSKFVTSNYVFSYKTQCEYCGLWSSFFPFKYIYKHIY